MKLRHVILGGVLLTGAVALGAGAYQWQELTKDLPSVDVLDEYEPAEVTVLYDREGTIIGELYEERRYVLPIEEIPERVQHAFIAAEDASFLTHGGVDYRGIARAALANLDSGRASQGASTITQQVARNLVLGDRRKTIERKLKEIAIAWRIEEQYDKSFVLGLYLNDVYLGAQSYGVEAASRSYFDKHVDELTLAQAAMLAGLPQRPSAYNPYRNPDAARARQHYVLGQMVQKGFVTEAEAEEARNEELALHRGSNIFRSQVPHFTEHVRRLLVERYGEDKVAKGGLRVTTTCDMELQKAAQAAVTARVEKLDHESGFRRANVKRIPKEEIEAWRAEVQKDLDPTFIADKVYKGVVTSVSGSKAVLGVGDKEVILYARDHPWLIPGAGPNFTAKISTEEQRREHKEKMSKRWSRIAAIKAAREEAMMDAMVFGGDEEMEEPAPINIPVPEMDGVQLLDVGDIVRITVPEVEGDPPEKQVARIYQPRELEGALLSMELGTGKVRAVVGGADFAGSQFNRATQGRRQVGSTFKPFVYGTAIQSKKLTAASFISDSRLVIKIGKKKEWKPKNYKDKYGSPMTMTAGLARSRNVVLVRTLVEVDEWMDHDNVYNFARKLGLGGPPSDALPEGWTSTPETSYLCPWTKESESAWYCRDHYPPLEDPEMDVRVHRKTEVNDETEHWCRSCDYSVGLGSTSLTVEEMVRAYSAFATQGKLVQPQYIEEVKDRHGEVIDVATTEHPQVLDPAVAYITHFMLDAVTNGGGTAVGASSIGLYTAGKTGTTDEGRDAWFIGYTPEVITGVWIGFDQPQSISSRATGTRVALPVWIEYMAKATEGEEKKPFPRPEKGVVDYANISYWGSRVSSGGKSYPFMPGTVPSLGKRAIGSVAPPPPKPKEEDEEEEGEGADGTADDDAGP